MEHLFKDHSLIEYYLIDGNNIRRRYHCTNCNLYFSFNLYPNDIESDSYISTYPNMLHCDSLTKDFINLTCEEIQIKNILE